MSRALTRTRSELAEQNVDLERLANVLRAVLDSTIDGILLSDAEGNMQLANRPLVRLTREMGMSYDGTIVDRLLSVQAPHPRPEGYRKAMEGCARTLTSRPSTSSRTRPAAASSRGSPRRCTTTAAARRPHLDAARRDEQRELDRLKDDFVATVSHELRTPLTSMMGFLEMIREGEAGELNDEQKRFLAIVYRSSERLQRLVGDLLFVARLDANGLQLQFAERSSTRSCASAVESSGALARAREITLVAEVEPSRR